MDRFNGPPSLMIVSDLDFTMVDHEDPENLSLLRFNSLWEAYYRQFSLLSDTEQRPHKLDVKMIYSSGILLDILPKGGGKGQALAYLLRKFKANGTTPLNSLVCGDSGNDADLFTIPQVYGVMVSNAQEELLQWHSENAKNNPNIIHSSERCASGIIQAIGKFSLGPDVSPRDFGKCRVNVFSPGPGFEVVKFYLFYERWRRAEVDKSDRIFQNLESSFYPLGNFVHPCGTEQPMNKCTDMMERLYGDKQGKRYRIWLDRVSTLRIGSDSWLVKFDKWESTGEERYCCLTTVLLTTKQAEESFTWMHIHQTWLDGLEAKDPSVWFL
ncbi:hypothetical protein GQ457_03G028410 [Hibiscus cannabinus]